MHIPAVYNAPPYKPAGDSLEGKSLPCVVFSHGLGGNRLIYSTYCCELASQGCLVACVEHRYDRPTRFIAHSYLFSTLIKIHVLADKTAIWAYCLVSFPGEMAVEPISLLIMEMFTGNFKNYFWKRFQYPFLQFFVIWHVGNV